MKTIKGTNKNLLKRKQAALNFFLNYLLGKKEKNSIGKVFLFGSVANNTVSSNGDIDLLIFASSNFSKIRNICADAALETWIKFSESIEPLVYCLDDQRFPNSYFLSKAVSSGKEVYSMKKEDLIKKEAQGYLDLAKVYLEGAKRNFKIKDYRITADAGYNSAELCAKGLILLKKNSIPKSHGGVVGEFGKLYIKTGLLATKIGRQFNSALEIRNKARYDFHSQITREIANDILNLAKYLIQMLDRTN